MFCSGLHIHSWGCGHLQGHVHMWRQRHAERSYSRLCNRTRIRTQSDFGVLGLPHWIPPLFSFRTFGLDNLDQTTIYSGLDFGYLLSQPRTWLLSLTLALTLSHKKPHPRPCHSQTGVRRTKQGRSPPLDLVTGTHSVLFSLHLLVGFWMKHLVAPK